MTPPHCMNCEIWSTSLVTRETSDAAPLGVLVQHDRSCTCRNAWIRRVARPRLGAPEEPDVHPVRRERR